MRGLAGYKSLSVVALLIAGAPFTSPAASASTLTFDLTTCQVSGGCGSNSVLGTVTVAQIGSNEVSVGLTLASGEVFAFGGAGQPLLFNLAGDPSPTVSTPTSNLSQPETFAFNNSPMTMADGTGKWDYFISCTSCGTGTSMSSTGQGGAPVSLSFDVTLNGITPASFAESTKGFTFATDVGIPNGSGGYMTGDVAATTAVPLPSSLLLLGSALLAALVLVRRGAAAALAQP